MPRGKNGTRMNRRNSGQFLILSAVSIVLLIVSVASVLAYSSVSRVSLVRTDFRRTASEINLNFRGALAAALSEVSVKLEYRADISRFKNNTSLQEYSEAKSEGYNFLSNWQTKMLAHYAGLGLNLSVTEPTFQCEWGFNPGYTTASSHFSFDISAYRFYGWKSEASIELNLKILDLNETDGETVSFFFELQKENGVPVTDLSQAMTSVLFKHVESGEFTPSGNFNLRYLGNGCYLVKFSMYSSSIIEGLNEIKDYANQNMTTEDFKPGYNSTLLINLADQVIEEYNNSRLSDAYNSITSSKGWIVQNENTGYVLAWIDIVRSQLQPTVRIALRDSRGIVVSAFRRLVNIPVDITGPTTRSVYASPNPTSGSTFVTVIARIDDLDTGLSNIDGAEYFVDAIGQDGMGTRMTAADGDFDFVSEEVTSKIDVSGWMLGDYIIYVHGKDESGFWGDFKNVTVTVTEAQVIHVSRIDMYLRLRKGFWNSYYAEAVVTIVDDDGNPIEDAKVYGHWSASVSGNVEGLTNEHGMVGFTSQNRGGRPVFTFTVDNIVKSGCIYNPSLNVETSDTIRV